MSLVPVPPPPLAVRLCKRKWASTAWSGNGAALAGGRWNPPGVRVVYAATSQSLATLEFLVHVDLDTAPPNMVRLRLVVPPDVSCVRAPRSTLPHGWRSYPAPRELLDLGRRWVESETSLLLVVPSVVVPEEDNVLINPMHPEMARLQLPTPEPLEFDSRLWGAAD